MPPPDDNHPDHPDHHDPDRREEPRSLVTAERHGFDPLSLLFGLIFTVIGALALAGGLRPFLFQGDWIGPVLLIATGLALVTTLGRNR